MHLNRVQMSFEETTVCIAHYIEPLQHTLPCSYYT